MYVAGILCLGDSTVVDSGRLFSVKLQGTCSVWAVSEEPSLGAAL